MKLCLGMVQFGMDYGAGGKRKPPVRDCMDMLDYAVQNGVRAIDTASAYGEAEAVVGGFLARGTVPRSAVSIVSKVRPNILDGLAPKAYYGAVRASLEHTLELLGTDYLDGYLYHSARYVFDDEKLMVLDRLKKEGLVRAVGVSVYEPGEAVRGVESPLTDMLQLPYSVFDQRMAREGVFPLAKRKHTAIHIRSVFLQGLIVMDETQVPQNLERARPVVQRVRAFCARWGVSPIALALHFAKAQSEASHLVFGVRDMEQLRQDIRLFGEEADPAVLSAAGAAFRELDADIIMPSLWAK